eukprot:m.479121 g.479121  ORF g.479121 m.479121 type:complete len:154 (+) comp21325_c0_seq1:61-522(+)
MGKKDKKADKSMDEGDDDKGGSKLDYETLAARVSVISRPLASKKLTKKIYKTVKKAHKAKLLCRGVKEVSKAVRKGQKGVVVIAGDISPIDVISHLPVMCEDARLPYCYVPSKEDLGAAGQTKRPTSVVLLKAGDIEGLDAVEQDIKAMPAGF